MFIRTVLGDISPQELGVTACHEHLLWTVPEPYSNEDPDLGFDSVPASVAELRHFQAAGGSALVEMTTEEIGRSPLELRQISRAAGVHVIAASGHHKDKFSAAFLAGKTVEEMAHRIESEIVDGIYGGPVKAGLIKAGTSQDRATESELRVIQAVGLAHQHTGAPVSTHTEAGTFALQQAELLIQSGVPAERLCIGHLDRGIPEETILALAKRGVYLGFDQVGKNKYWPDSERAALIKRLAQAGYAHQILLAGDTARKSAWHTHNPRVEGIAHLLICFVPVLQKAGLSQEQIRMMLVENPARFLAF